MQEKCPKFSIIVPVYQVEKFLTECIESILKQHFRDFELVLVDDGSLDGSSAICDCYAARDGRIKVIHKQNGGLVSARKAGINQSCGQYIINIDGDDRMGPDMLDKIAEVIKRYNEPDIISFGLRHITEEGEVIDSDHESPSEGEYSRQKGNINSILQSFLLTKRIGGKDKAEGLLNSVCLKAIKRERVLTIQNAVPEQIQNGEDAAVVIPAAYASDSIVVMHDALYDYRIRKDSMVRSMRADLLDKTADLVDYLRQAVPAFPEYNYICFTYSQIEKYLLLAARSCATYTSFTQAAEKCRTTRMTAVLKAYSAPEGMKRRYRFKIWFTKQRWFGMYWLLYHRRR